MASAHDQSQTFTKEPGTEPRTMDERIAGRTFEDRAGDGNDAVSLIANTIDYEGGVSLVGCCRRLSRPARCRCSGDECARAAICGERRAPW
jgi:hypothetical protein